MKVMENMKRLVFMTIAVLLLQGCMLAQTSGTVITNTYDELDFSGWTATSDANAQLFCREYSGAVTSISSITTVNQTSLATSYNHDTTPPTETSLHNWFFTDIEIPSKCWMRVFGRDFSFIKIKYTNKNTGALIGWGATFTADSITNCWYTTNNKTYDTASQPNLIVRTLECKKSNDEATISTEF